jgi:CRP-like cAMP-binding protein
LAKSLLQTEHRLFAQSKLPLKVRLAELMLDMAEAEGQLLSLSRSELADWEGVSPESISRSLKCLKDDGCIAIRGHKIEVIDPQALRELVEAF